MNNKVTFQTRRVLLCENHAAESLNDNCIFCRIKELQAQVERVKKVADDRSCLDEYEAQYIYAAIKGE